MAEPAWGRDRDAAQALGELIAAVADTKYFLGKAISEWAVGAPTLESAVACAAVAQEDLGHARALYPLLAELPGSDLPSPLERDDDRPERYCVACLDLPRETWADLIAQMLLVDSAALTVIEAFVAGTYAKLATRAARIVNEERFHLQFIEGRVRDLLELPDGIEHLQQQVDDHLPELLCWFGRSGSDNERLLRESSAVTSSSDDLRVAYLGRIAPILLEVGVELPIRWNLSECQWEYDELRWSDWDAKHRRLAVAPP